MPKPRRSKPARSEKKLGKQACTHPTVILERAYHEDVRLEYLTGKHVCLVCGTRITVLADGRGSPASMM